MSMTESKRTLTDMVYDKLSEYGKIGTVEELRKAVKEEDVLKFYYIESEDKYVVGQRVDTMYYGEIGKTGITFYMSRYLPWGEHIVAPETAWKEYTYPSEPKEIPFFDWLQGFMKKEYGGTPEEFRELKEKATPKKIGHCVFYKEMGYATPWQCLTCGADQIEADFSCEDGSELEEKHTYCWNCGQKLDWSEEKE